MHPTALQQIAAQHINDLHSEAAEQRLVRQLPARGVTVHKALRRWVYRQPSLYSRRRQRRQLQKRGESISHLRELQIQTLPESVPAPNGDDSPEQRAVRHGVTPRELTVLGLLAEGLTAVAMARRLSISVHTVTKHQHNLYRKLGTTDRLATVLLAQNLGLVTAPAIGVGTRHQTR
jgi:DNA-binding CsgD family transcriptional regulator